MPDGYLAQADRADGGGDRFCGHFDDLFARLAERTALRHYLIGLLLPRERNKTLTELAALAPDADRQRLHHFLHDAPWDSAALNARRLEPWRGNPDVGPHANGVLIIDETGDRKRGRGIVLAARQYIGKLGHTANGVVSVTSHWADGTLRVPLGVRPCRPAARLAKGKADPAFATKPAPAWELTGEARAAGVPFRAVVADCVYGENPRLEGRLRAAGIRYVLALRPRHGTWQAVDDPARPPAFTPAEAAARLPLERWQRLVLTGSRGRPLVRYVAELELGPCYGPACGTRPIAASAEPAAKPESTWFMAASLSVAEADTAEVYRIYRLRDWTGHSCKPARHELGWADFQVRSEEAIVRHRRLVMLAFTFSLLTAAPAEQGQEAPPGDSGTAAGEKSATADHLAVHAAAGPQLAVPVGAPAGVLAPLAGRSAPAGTGGAA